MSRGSRLRRGYRLWAEGGPLVLCLASVVFGARRISYSFDVVAHYVRMLREAVEYSRETGTPIDECLVAIRSGFTPETYAFLGLESRDPGTYVSRDAKKYVGAEHAGPIRSANRNARRVLHDKLATTRVLDRLGDRFPEIYGTVQDGRYVSWDDGASRSLLDAVETYGTVIAKPVAESEGEGFYRLSVDGGFSMNGDPADASEIDRLQYQFDDRDYIVTEHLRQHAYSREIFPDSTNTLRVHTVMDPETGEPFLVRPSHRFGTGESSPVDAFAKGGVVAPIDPESGELAPLIVLDERGNRLRMDEHPETGARVAGVHVPMWDEIEAVAVAGARAYPMARIVGWDFLVTPDRSMVLEASGHPNPIGAQLERGLLEDPVARRVIETAERRANST